MKFSSVQLDLEWIQLKSALFGLKNMNIHQVVTNIKEQVFDLSVKKQVKDKRHVLWRVNNEDIVEHEQRVIK